MWPWLFTPIFVVVLGLWLGWMSLHWLLIRFGHSYPIEKLAQWGDSFGGLNALFAALAFFAVIITLQQQMSQSRQAYVENQKQRFESVFFTLLGLLRELRGEVRFKHSNMYLNRHKNAPTITLKGARAIRRAWFEAIFHIRGARTGLTAEEVGVIYEQMVHKRFESNFGPYFRMVYTILARIKSDSFLSDQEKARYGNIVRSQLTSFELAVASLNALAPMSKDLKIYIVHFRILKYVPPGARRRILMLYFPEEAFKQREDNDD